MKVNAYRCDYCGEIKPEHNMQGVDCSEDMFDKLKSFPINPFPERTPVHVCVDCMRDNAAVPAENETNRKKDEKAYRAKYEELSFLVRSQCVRNVYSKKVFKIS